MDAADAIQDDQRGALPLRHLIHVPAGPWACFRASTVITAIGRFRFPHIAEVIQDDFASAGIGFGIGDNPIQLLLAMSDMLFAIGGGFFDFFRIPRAFAEQHAQAFIAEVFQRPGAFQRGQPHLELDWVHPGDLGEAVERCPDLAAVLDGVVDGAQIVPGQFALLDEKFLQGAVLRVVEQDNFGGQAVASRAARLLVVRFERTWQGIMDHLAHVGAVNAHAESVGGSDDVHLTRDEIVLDARPFFSGQSGVIELGGDTDNLARELGGFLGVAACAGVDDGRAILWRKLPICATGR